MYCIRACRTVARQRGLELCPSWPVLSVTSQVVHKWPNVLKEARDFNNNAIASLSTSTGAKTIVQLDHCAFHALVIEKTLLKKVVGSDGIKPVNTDDVDWLEKMAMQMIPPADLTHLSRHGTVQLGRKANGNNHTRIISGHLNED